MVTLGPLPPALDALTAPDGHAVVLASGDPGFFGIVRRLRAAGLAPQVLPAVSSVALAFARVGLPWDDAVVVSRARAGPAPALAVGRAGRKVAVLTSPGCGPGRGRRGRGRLGPGARGVRAPRRPGRADRRVAPAEAATREWRDPNVVLVLGRPGDAGRPQSAQPRPAATLINRLLRPGQDQSV